MTIINITPPILLIDIQNNGRKWIWKLYKQDPSITDPNPYSYSIEDGFKDVLKRNDIWYEAIDRGCKRTAKKAITEALASKHEHEIDHIANGLQITIEQEDNS